MLKNPLRSLGLTVLLIWIPFYYSQFESGVVSNLISKGCSQSSLGNSIHLPQDIFWCFCLENFSKIKLWRNYFFQIQLHNGSDPIVQYTLLSPTLHILPSSYTVYIKKNVGVFASMLYVYYKFHMQCVNQQKVDKKEKNCCTTAITLRRRKNQSQKYIYIKQTNKSFMNSYLISFLSKIICITDNLW